MPAKTVSFKSIRDDILSDPEVLKEYNALEEEFNVARQVISLRQASCLTQREFAERMGIKQSQLARIESGRQLPKLQMLAKIADVAGYDVQVSFVPRESSVQQQVRPIQVNCQEPVSA